MNGWVFKQDGMDVAFDVIDGDQRDVATEGEGLGVGDADQQRADEAGAWSHGDGVERGPIDIGVFERLTDGGDDGAEVFPRGEFGDDAAVFGVSIELRSDHAGQNASAIGNNGGCGFIA